MGGVLRSLFGPICIVKEYPDNKALSRFYLTKKSLPHDLSTLLTLRPTLDFATETKGVKPRLLRESSHPRIKKNTDVQFVLATAGLIKMELTQLAFFIRSFLRSQNKKNAWKKRLFLFTFIFPYLAFLLAKKKRKTSLQRSFCTSQHNFDSWIVVYTTQRK